MIIDATVDIEKITKKEVLVLNDTVSTRFRVGISLNNCQNRV